MAGLASQRTSVIAFWATARQVNPSQISGRLSSGGWRASGFCSCRFARSSETTMPDGWTRVSEGLGSRFCVRRRGRRNSGRFSGVLCFRVGGFLRFGVFRLFMLRRSCLNSRRFSSDSSSEELAISGGCYLRNVGMEIAFFIF